MSEIYTPDMGLKAKFERRAALKFACRNITPKPSRPIVSFSFDDCPKSALDKGAALLEAEGWRATFYMAMGLCGTSNHLGLHMNEDDVKAAHQSGHEIADHTYGHIDAQTTPLPAFMADIEKNQATLAALGIPPSRNFAYPYGSISPKAKALTAQSFELVRGVHNPSSAQVDTAFMPSMRMYSGDSVDTVIQTIKAMPHATDNTPQWLTLFTHDVRDTPSGFGCTPGDMVRIISAIKDAGLDVMPMDKALDTIKMRAV